MSKTSNPSLATGRRREVALALFLLVPLAAVLIAVPPIPQDLERIASEVETQVTATANGAAGVDIDWGRVGPLVEAWEGLAQSVAKRLLRLNRAGNVQGGGTDIGQSSAVA